MRKVPLLVQKELTYELETALLAKSVTNAFDFEPLIRIGHMRYMSFCLFK